jgi:hypothetical protein
LTLWSVPSTQKVCGAAHEDRSLQLLLRQALVARAMERLVEHCWRERDMMELTYPERL